MSADGQSGSTDLYALLGADVTATVSQLRSSYYRLARATHPDRRPPDAAAVPSSLSDVTSVPAAAAAAAAAVPAHTFQQVQHAWHVLSDAERRSDYDRRRRQRYLDRPGALVDNSHLVPLSRLPVVGEEEGEAAGGWRRQQECRCGGHMAVSGEELAQLAVGERLLLLCDDCSASVLVLVDTLTRQ